MAKMRGIKPETFTDDKILQVSPLARWLFIGMWTLACDNGHIEDNPVQLKVRLLPMDSCDVRELVNELTDTGMVVRHEGFLSIPNLPEHQKIDRRFLVFCKWCDHDAGAKFSTSDKLPRRAEKDSQDANSQVNDSNSSGARRANDVRSSGARRALVDEGEGEGEGELTTSVDQSQPQLALVQEESSATPSDRFEEFWKAYPKRTPHSNPKKPAREKFLQVAKKVHPQTLIDAAISYAKIRKGEDPQFTVQTIKWLRDERWNDEMVTQKRPQATPAHERQQFVPLSQRAINE